MQIKLIILLICFHLSIGDDSPPEIEISYLKDCVDQEVPALDGFECETEITGEGLSKSLNAKITVPFDVDNSLKYEATVKRWMGEQWKPVPLKLSGSVCEHVQRFMPGLWSKLSKVVNVPYDCPIKAGSFSVNSFTAESKDVNFPFLPPGKYEVSARVLKDDKLILCKQSEVTIMKS